MNVAEGFAVDGTREWCCAVREMAAKPVFSVFGHKIEQLLKQILTIRNNESDSHSMINITRVRLARWSLRECVPQPRPQPGELGPIQFPVEAQEFNKNLYSKYAAIET